MADWLASTSNDESANGDDDVVVSKILMTPNNNNNNNRTASCEQKKSFELRWRQLHSIFSIVKENQWRLQEKYPRSK
jgi:hypothetical protein